MKKQISLFKAFLELKTEGEVKNFLKDILTPKEFKDLEERWIIAQMLSGGASYRAVNEATGVSTTTIGRVARFLKDENYGGYTTVLKRINNIKDKKCKPTD